MKLIEVHLQVLKHKNIFISSRRPSGVVLRNSSRDVFVEMFRGDSEQEEQADDDSGAAGARPRRGHRGGRRVRHVGPAPPRRVLSD